MVTPLVESGWYYLGPGANNGQLGGTNGIVVKPTESTKVISPIVDWENVWDDGGSGNKTDFSLWRGVPAFEDRQDFVGLGSFFVRRNTKPTAEEAAGMVAVHKDLLVHANLGTKIWDDDGTGAKRDGRVWDVSTQGIVRGIYTGAFVCGNSPPSHLFAIDRDQVSYDYE
jgi:hypothetical protein